MCTLTSLPAATLLYSHSSCDAMLHFDIYFRHVITGAPTYRLWDGDVNDLRSRPCPRVQHTLLHSVTRFTPLTSLVREVYMVKLPNLKKWIGEEGKYTSDVTRGMLHGARGRSGLCRCSCVVLFHLVLRKLSSAHWRCGLQLVLNDLFHSIFPCKQLSTAAN
jgi:hypothetical protein